MKICISRKFFSEATRRFQHWPRYQARRGGVISQLCQGIGAKPGWAAQIVQKAKMLF